MDFNFADYIDPSLFVLVPVLISVGAALKKSRAINNKYIPLILLGAGIMLAVGWKLSAGVSENVFACVFAAICQGALCSGAAVYSHQIYKNTKQCSCKGDKKE